MNKNDLKIVMCGCCEVGIDMVKDLVESGIKINHFVSLNSEKAEKCKISGYSSFEPIASKFKIPIYYAQNYNLNTEQDLSFFKKNRFDILLVGGWQRLIPSKVLNELSIGGFGFHGSSEFLPKGRGRSPINWSLLEGKKRFIMHLFLMEPEADNGNIIDIRVFDINEWDNCRTLYYKYSLVAKEMLISTINKIKNGGEISPYKQIGEPTYYPKRTPDDGEIDWNKSVFQIYDFIRALTKPYPGAYSYINGKRNQIWKAQPFDTRITYYGKSIGEVVDIFQSGDFIVNCNSGLLLIEEADFVPEKGDVFTSVNIRKNL